MKQIITYIKEGLRINKNIKVKDIKDIEIKMGEKTKITKEELKEIKEYCIDLPIIPNLITNYSSPQPINPKRSSSAYHSGSISLVYYRNEDIKPTKHENNKIRINKDNDGGIDKYFIRFIKIDEVDTYFYPENSDELFYSIKECFDCIKEKWDVIKFSEAINKYK